MRSSDFEQMKTDIALIRQDVTYIKDRLSKVEGTLYSLGAVIIFAVLTAVVSFFVRTPILK